MKVILASASPRRKEHLSKIFSQFDVVPSTIVEDSTAELPVDVAEELACRKASDVYSRTEGERLVIGSDTVVDLNGKLMGKPADENEARAMLGELSGKTHCVHSGVCIITANAVSLFTVTTKVKFRALSKSEIEAYVATGSPLDKAGAYGIQDSNFVESIDGSYDNVTGFPTERITEELIKMGIIER